MKFYLIVSSEKDTPSKDLLTKVEAIGKVAVIRHKGKLSQVKQLKNDQEDKVIGVDPKVFGWDLDVQALKDVPNVKAICTSSTSFDWLKPKELTKMGIIACNVPGFSSDSVAEYALFMAIAVTRGMPAVVKNGWKYDIESGLPMQLKGKTAGIIGLGRIGTRMAELCKGIGMEVIYWSRKSRDKRFKYVELDELFKTADLIMPALVENERTKKLVNHNRVDLMKPSAVLVGINRVRAIWDEDYVLGKVKKGEIGGYALEGENLNPPSEYEGNVLPLPSMAGYTKDAFENLIEIWVENLIAVGKGKPQNIVT